MHFNSTLRNGFAVLLAVCFATSAFSQAETQNPSFPFWKTNGNINTNTGTNFIGTVDNFSLAFRTNNIQRMVIDTFGRVGIQTSTPVAPLDVAQTNGSSNFTVVTTNYGNPNDVLLSRAQGTITAPTIIGAGGTGVYSRIIARGYDGAFFRTAAQIAFEVDAATGSGDMPGRITFFTTPDGSSTTAERMRIEQTGEVGIGVLNPLRALHIGGLTNSIRIDGLATGGSFITAPSATTDKIMYADANGDVRTMAAGTTGQLLTYTAAGPAWSTATSNDWSITGNAGLSAATNFLGTTDNTDVLIKRQNEEALRVYPGGALIGIGNTATGAVPLAGFGTRLMWAPAKAAFRAGSVNGAQWDNANVGTGSAAFGANNTASGVNAFVSGSGNTVSGQNSVAYGNSNTVTATHALVSGNANNAAGNYSVVFNNTASSTAAATTSVAGGFQSQTQANLSIAIGWADTAKGVASVALGGFSNEARSDYSFAAGNNNLSSANQAAAFGNNNVASGTNAFVAGSSNTVSNAQSAAFGVTNTVSGTNSLVAGSTNTVSAGQSLVAGFSNNVSGDVSVVAGSSNTVPSIRSMVSGANNNVAGENNLVSGFQNQIVTPYGHSIVVGYQDTLSASSSAVFGFLNKVTAFTGFAVGDRNLVTGQTSSAFGYQNVASGTNSFVTGQQDTTLGNLSSAFGTGNRAASFNEMAIGMYGTQYTAASTSAFNATDRVFNVGIGTSSGARANAFTILKGGNVRVAGLATGGTFISAPAATTDKLMFADANGDLRAFANGSSGQTLTINGSGVPAWSTASSNDWAITGNSGTVDGTNFIGTTDNVPVNFRVNNTTAGRIDSAYFNSFYGFRSGNSSSTGLRNSAFGYRALFANSTGSGNVAIGAEALQSNTANSNTAVGYRALRNSTTPENNTAIGKDAMLANTNGTDNVAVGQRNMVANTGGDYNASVGSEAMFTNDGGGWNSVLGFQALYTNFNGDYNTAVGNRSLYSNNSGGGNTAIGSLALFKNTTSNNTALGDSAAYNIVGGSSNVALGNSAMLTNISGGRNTSIGNYADVGSAALTNATAVGANAQVDASNSMVLGSVNGVNGATATVSVGIGINTPLRTFHVGGLTNGIRYSGVATGGTFITTPSATSDKIMFADANGDVRAMTAGSTGQVLTYTASGPAWSTATSNDWGITGNASTVDGTNFLGTTDNIPFTIRVNNQRSGRIDNTNHNATWGYRAGSTLSTGTFNTLIGDSAGFTIGTNTRNVAVGASALRDLSSLGTGKDNVAIGVNAMRDVANAEKNVAVGNEALRFMFSGYGDNVAIGDSAGHNSRWDNNIAIGSSTLLNANTNGGNIAIGTRALYNLNAPSPYMSSNNVAIGYRAMYSTLPTATTDGNNNVSIGNYTLTDNTTGYNNAALGNQSLWNNTNGFENTAVGNLSLENNTTGDQNVSLGSGAGTTNATGNANTLLGYNAETNATNLVNSTAIGANARVDASNSMVLGSVNGVNGATATVSVGIGVNTPLRTLHVGGLTNGIRYTGVATGGSFITVPSAVTDKIVFADANGDLRALAAGTTNHVLTMTASGPAWAAASGSSAWALTGNSSTSAATNYLGTTDNVDFLIKTSATERMRFIGNTPQIVINNATPSAASILSVFSTTTDDALVLNANGTGRGLLINTATTNSAGDGIEIQKGGSGGIGIELVMSSTNTGAGISANQSGSGRVAAFQQLNSSVSAQAVFIQHSGNAKVLQVQNTSSSATQPIINAAQQSTQNNSNAASVFGSSNSNTGGFFSAAKLDNSTRALEGRVEFSSGGAFDATGVYGDASQANAGYGYGVYGIGNRYGVFANGNLGASGVKSFEIDHPLDPANKLLKHYSMESPEVLNMYRGSVLLNTLGEAEIQLPDYFHAININFTYVLTPVGAPADMYVKTEVDNTGKFVIAGGKPGLKISWYVYAERNDAYLQQKPWSKEVVVRKKEHEAGKYLQPELYGQPKEKGIFYRPAPTVKAVEEP